MPRFKGVKHIPCCHLTVVEQKKEKKEDPISRGLVTVKSIMHLDLLCEISDDLRMGRK